MIPKIIHYCWLSDDSIPNDLQKWMQTWNEKLPDWEIRLWNKQRFDINSVKWVKEAYEAKKYAFAADYIRQYAVYNYGGFYMDMDIEVIKNFDYLLSRPYVLGAETEDGIEAGVFGAEKGSPLIKACLDWYKDKSFIKNDGSYNIQKCPKVMMDAISKIKEVRISSDFVDDNKIVCLLPRDFLTAKSSATGMVTKTTNTITIHHFAGSWLKQSKIDKAKKYIKKIVGNIAGEGFLIFINSLIYGEKRMN